MEATYLDFRYLQLKKIPSSSRCIIFSLLAGIALALPYLFSLIFGATVYFTVQPYYDHSGAIRVNPTIANPYSLDFCRYIGKSFTQLLTDLAIYLVAINLWSFFMSWLLNDTKQRWQFFLSAITIGFSLPVIVFTLSIFTDINLFDRLNGILNNPIAIYLLLSFALGITFGPKKLMDMVIPSLIGYLIGHLILIYAVAQISKISFDSLVSTGYITNWLLLIQILKNLIWNFLLGLGVYSTYRGARKLTDSLAHFENRKTQ
ncbi:MAG: hypothetical protein ABIK93_04610 [candidate division WOR-3 bacterium]